MWPPAWPRLVLEGLAWTQHSRRHGGQKVVAMLLVHTRRVQSEYTPVYMCDDVGRVIVLHRLTDNISVARVDGVLLPSEKLVESQDPGGSKQDQAQPCSFPDAMVICQVIYITCQNTAPPEILPALYCGSVPDTRRYVARPNVDGHSTTQCAPPSTTQRAPV